MEITLTRPQWVALKDIVAHGARAERTLGVPMEITNSDQSIEITATEIKIVLDD